VAVEVTGPSGAQYRIKIEAWWEDMRTGLLMVWVTLDEGRWRSLSDDFIIAADGSFVGE
jgi:hypothetical protein